MDSLYPSRYRYSPERLKKALSCQSDEFQKDGRQGRRQSEPNKQTPKSSRAAIKHSDSEGVLPGKRRSLQPATSSSTPGSGPGDSEADHAAADNEEEEEEEEEELGSRKDSLERLLCSEEEEEEEAGTLSPQRSHRTPAEDSEPDDLLLEDEQEADASGVSNGCEQENGRLPEEDEPGGAEPTNQQPCRDELPHERTSESEQTEDLEPEASSDPNSLSSAPPTISASPPRSEDLKPEGDPDPTELPSSATPDSDSKTLSSGESSEDEEDVKEAPEKGGKTSSILPSSVLDKASAIAQHFTNSIRRGSLSQDDTRSLSCASPRLPSRTGSSISLSAENPDRALCLNSICSDPAETFGMTDLTLLSPRDDSLFDADRGIRRRRDSTLSKQDQLLIGKIKSYYENAESQDASFCLQRRESLTYIPTGLVRSSVSRLNSIPNSETFQVNPSSSTSSSSLEPNTALPSDTRRHVVSSDSLDPFKSEQRSTDPEDSEEGLWSRSQSLQDYQGEDEEFRPSSEMIKIWQTMERKITRSQSEDRGRERSREALRRSRANNLSDATKSTSCDRERGASGLSDITEESRSPSPLKLRACGVNRTGSLKDTLKVFGEESGGLRAPIPRVAQLKAEGQRPGEDSNQLDDNSKSKVLHLARQYSQRIKTTKPVVRQRSQGLLMGKKTLPCVVEERESAGKPSLTLPLVSQSQASSQPLSPADRSGTPGLACRSALASSGQARSRSPLSPLSPPLPIEGFNWPDVRQLRSKYSEHGRSQTTPVSRSRSIPEQMFDGSLRRHSSCSSSLLLADGASGAPENKSRGSRDASGEERRRRLQRANSLDPRLSGAQMTELQKLQDQATHGDYEGYYVAAEASLPDDPEHKIVVVEKFPEPESEVTPAAKEDEDDSYIQIRSPTSREKISIMAVIDRCRVYQESDEYKQREDVKAKAEPGRPPEPDAGDQDDESQKINGGQKTDGGQQSIVKNLREKFQNLS
ncbi:pleckstrin homology domain-containing family G member 3-like isoform X2 [Plectropomus leopardus]|uniref:pleckstrin homology domain-containing family G member 3-like isoform X2 n=1 Tax=Plectropomus leopardus TaxID=160734 RepID=UPI001C4D8788|nr:pleckstrin homology domain-containing family G member 3-like isoform X2 [Plectropomus leopardus]